jgi:hypothetical protein
MRRGWIAGAFAAGVLACGSAQAHHSFAMFDFGKNVALKGTIADFQWTNPHSWIEIDVPTAAGGVDKWSIELNSPNNLTRQGWTRHELKPGDKVVLVINPMKDGSKGGLFYAVTLPDGREVRDPRVGPGPINVQAP